MAKQPLQPVVDLSHKYLKPGPGRKVMVTCTIQNPRPTVQQSFLQRVLKALIDTSGSTSGRAGGSSNKSILQAVKDGLTSIVDRIFEDTWISLDTFAASHDRVVKTQTTLAARNEFKKALKGLSSRGSTGITDGLRRIAWSKQPGNLTRGFVFTDGMFNLDNTQDLLDIMQDHTLCVPVWFVGIGVTYDEDILTRLAEIGPPGSVFKHVSSADELEIVADELLATLDSLGGYTGVSVKFSPMNGVSVDFANRFVPGFSEISVNPTQTWHVDALDDSLDPRGQQILVGFDIPADVLYQQYGGRGDVVVEVAKYEITYMEDGVQAAPIEGVLSLTITDNESLIAANPPNQTVLNTMFTRVGHLKTLEGNFAEAATLMSRAGHTAVAVQLNTMVSGGNELHGREVRNLTRFAGREALKTIQS